MRDLKKQERTAFEAVARRFSATWEKGSDPSAQALVERGRTLVAEVAKCGDCHTPKDRNGKPDASRLLKGVPADPATPDLTPSGRLWASWKQEGIYRFLVTGLAPSGQPARHPMPAYKLKPDDAEAVVAYLKTLK